MARMTEGSPDREHIGEMVDILAETLPEGYTVRLCVENSAAWVELVTPVGSKLSQPDDDSRMSLLAGLRWAFFTAHIHQGDVSRAIEALHKGLADRHGETVYENARRSAWMEILGASEEDIDEAMQRLGDEL